MTGRNELTLTPRDLERVAAVRDSWVPTGLSTDAVIGERAWPLVRALYAAHGLPAPALRVRMSSPVGVVCAGLICSSLRGQEPGLLKLQFGGDVWNELDRQIDRELSGRPDWHPDMGAGFRAAIWARLRDPVGDPLGDLVLDRLRTQFSGSQLLPRFGDQLDGGLRIRLARELGRKLRGQLTDELWGQLRRELRRWGHLPMGPWESAFSLAVYDLALPIAGLPRSRKRDALEAVLRETGWFLPMRGAAVISDRPCRLELDALLFPHSGTGMAVAWRDGCGFHYWHGRHVPEWVISRPTIGAIAAEPNAEIRRCAIESLGWEAFVAQAGAVLIGTAADPGNPGQDLSLYEVPERLWGAPVNLLVAVNGTTERDGTRRRYGLTTPAEIRDPVAAAGWTYQLTKVQYAACKRRT